MLLCGIPSQLAILPCLFLASRNPTSATTHGAAWGLIHVSHCRDGIRLLSRRITVRLRHKAVVRWDKCRRPGASCRAPALAGDVRPSRIKDKLAGCWSTGTTPTAASHLWGVWKGGHYKRKRRATSLLVWYRQLWVLWGLWNTFPPWLPVTLAAATA